MREIKFRAWNNEHKKMYSWQEIVSDKYILLSVMGDEHYQTNPPRYFWERMQYTGLKDKNGVDVYEGDIVREGESVAAIEYDGTYSRFCYKTKTTKAGLYHFYGEIIGNIYENPELLETA